MATVYIFAEQVWRIVRAGKKEIEIPEGARISSAAADLIKEHQLQVKTVAPGQEASTDPEKRRTRAAVTASGRSMIRLLEERE